MSLTFCVSKGDISIIISTKILRTDFHALVSRDNQPVNYTRTAKPVTRTSKVRAAVMLCSSVFNNLQANILSGGIVTQVSVQ